MIYASKFCIWKTSSIVEYPVKISWKYLLASWSYGYTKLHNWKDYKSLFVRPGHKCVYTDTFRFHCAGFAFDDKWFMKIICTSELPLIVFQLRVHEFCTWHSIHMIKWKSIIRHIIEVLEKSIWGIKERAILWLFVVGDIGMFWCQAMLTSEEIKPITYFNIL